jgi:hypothetical protein
MLTDFQKEMLELGAITLDDIRKEIGGDIYGDKVQEMIVINVARGYTKGRKDTVFIDDDFIIKPVELMNNKHDNNNDEDDIFSGLNDIPF